MDLPLRGLILTNDFIDEERSFGGITQLQWCSTDGNRIRRALLNHKIGEAEFTTYDEETWGTIHTAITQFFADEGDDLRLLYFAGHGWLDDNGGLYLLVRDSTHKNLEDTTIPADWLDKIIAKSPARRKIIILDCCYSAAFFTRLRGIKEPRMDEVIQGQGTIVIASSGAAERARDGRQSFTSYLVEGLENGEADRDGDGLVSLEEWFDYASNRIKENQKPRMAYYDRTSPIYIARTTKTTTEPAELPEPQREKPGIPSGWSGNGPQPGTSMGSFPSPITSDEPLITPIKAQPLVAMVRKLPPPPDHINPLLVLSIRSFDTQDIFIKWITCRAENIPVEQGLGGGYPLAPTQQINLHLPDFLLDAMNGFILIYTATPGGDLQLALVTEIPTELSDLTRHRRDSTEEPNGNPDDELHDKKLHPPSRTGSGPFKRR